MIIHQHLRSRRFTYPDMEGLQAFLNWRSELRQEIASEPYLVSLKQAHKGSIVDLASEVWVQLSGFLHATQSVYILLHRSGRSVHWH